MQGKHTPWASLFGFLPAAILAAFVTISLHDYTAPIFSVEQEDTAVSTQEITANGKKSSSKTAAVTTKAAPTVEPLAEQISGYKDGTYTGSGTGFSGLITVQVVIEGGKITDIIIVSTTDDSPYIDNASALLKTIIATQSTNVDTVSGATYSSVGLISAVRDALQKAGGSSAGDSALPTLAAANSNASGDAPSISAVSEPSSYRDGTYIGTGSGFAGAITVQVTVSDGKISDISVLSASDDSPYLDNAISLLNNIIASNSTNVDTVSGATFSSVGLIEAVRNALANAGADSGNNSEETTPEVPKGRFSYPDGVYIGSGEGYRGETTVAVSLKDGTIDNIMVMNTEDDAAYFKRAESLLKQVLQQQTTDLDAISGATFSSEGILEAIVDALEQAKQANSGNQTTTVTTAPIETTTTTVATTKLTETTELTPSLYIDGEYIGSAVCYPDDDEDFLPYDLTVKVCIENDQIISITDVEGFGADYDAANDWYIDRALNGTKKISGIAAQILAAQTTDVDAVSGATCSSDAILAAVQDALQQALREG
ncbi:FMN-binding protein [Ruminococcus sp.]|uniref:FMN-binding protein n=1 Tax=Ruminococcus sp. TaxID=41978 RepID=UPI003994B981